MSLEDDLLRIFGGERISNIMDRFGMEEDQPIEHTLITRAIENAQGRVEGHNFDIRKHLLEYDNVMNKQREIIYELRNKALRDESLEDLVSEYTEELAGALVDTFLNKDIHPDDIDVKGFKEGVFRQFSIPLRQSADDIRKLNADDAMQLILDETKKLYDRKAQEFTPELLHRLEKWIYLRILDERWKEHLLDLDHVKEGIGLRGYAQQDPLREYQKEAYDLFTDLDSRIKQEFIEKLFMVQIAREEDLPREPRPQQPQQFVLNRGDEETQGRTVTRKSEKVGRNDPCPCGSGKKYKKCCGAK
jgi:preprotein translocase subunit SecA